MIERPLPLVLAAVLTVTSFFCAGQVPPSGGPPDTIPPEILSASPEAGTINFHDKMFSLHFSKYVDRRSLEESIFISPTLGDLTFDWSGKDVEIRFADSLHGFTTYILTIGTDLKDTRSPANRMAKSYALPFSTGDHIDSASIAGSVVDANPEGVMIFAYQLSARLQDTLDPNRTKPDYITQTGKDGSFTMPYLAYGTYRVFAIRDEFKNLLYDRQTDQFGVSSSDVMLTREKPTFSGIQFRMTSEDTTAPFLSSARSIDRIHVLLRFSEPMDPLSSGTDGVTITDTLTRAVVQVQDLSFVGTHSLEAQLVTSEQDSGKVYHVDLKGFKDLHGNLISSALSGGDFIGSATHDTSKPSIDLIDSKENTAGVLVDDSIHVTFSEAIRKVTFEEGFSLSDSSRRQVRGRFLWLHSTEAWFVPAKPFAEGMRYTITIALDSVIDFAGNHRSDSLLIRHFETIDEKVISSISGIVVDEMKDGRGNIYLMAINVVNNGVKPRVRVLAGPGNFGFDGLAEGRYALWGFRDADSNGVYTFGKPFPLLFAERVTVYPETLKVRARWPLEDVRIRFR
ncbi:MAG: Ig-like domain-containing protein [Ignavibacteria bacterium]|nr:Ig-like domain-containing protein [Ignavibacteria bacterium]MBI3765442.1 Ig-like domain-containing protein [Ignavibacteriales bacterium]